MIINPFQTDLFSTIFCGNPVPLQVDKFTRVFQNSPLTMDNPLPPTAPGRQFFVSTAAPPKRVPSLQHCLLSDGGLDVEKYLHHQVTACKWLLWRTSMALNLIHSVGESISAGSKALSLATDFIKSRVPRCVYGHKDSVDSELQVMKPKECQW